MRPRRTGSSARKGKRMLIYEPPLPDGRGGNGLGYEYSTEYGVHRTDRDEVQCVKQNDRRPSPPLPPTIDSRNLFGPVVPDGIPGPENVREGDLLCRLFG